MNAGYLTRKLRERRAQILLPAVLLAPIFVLIIYLLFETAKVSMSKVRHQFALDNAAYSQVSSASTYLNAVAMTNGPLGFRVWRDYGASHDALPLKNGGNAQFADGHGEITIFELFYRSGAVPNLLKDEDGRDNNFRPRPEATDWEVAYIKEHPDEKENDNGSKSGNDLIISREDWNKETPAAVGDKTVRLLSHALVNNYHFPAGGDKGGIHVLTEYLTIYTYLNSIYKSQDYVYKEVTKNMQMFREAYFLNVSSCKKADCARESASKLRPYMNLSTKPQDIDKFEVFFSDGGAKATETHGGAQAVDLVATELLNGQRLFQFAYLDAGSRGKLRSLQRGVLLKQNYKLPRNHFNINLEQKYKPYVRNKVVLSCPRSSNNCVWPNPLPKYSVTLEP